MNRNYKQLLHLIYIAICLLCTACEDEIPYTPANKKTLLVMNALLDNGQTENSVHLHLSTTLRTERVNEATVVLYINNQQAEEAQAICPYTEQELAMNPHLAATRIFRLTSSWNPGDQLRLEATVENGKYHTTAQVTAPHPIAPIQVDTCTVRRKSSWGSKLHRQYKIALQDRFNEANCYRLEILNDINVRYRNNNTSYPDTYTSAHYNELINREDIVLTNGRPTNSDEEEENSLFPIIANKYNIFNDRLFSNNSYTMKVYTDLYSNYLATGPGSFIKAYINHVVTIRLLTITQETHRYLQALNNLESGEYNESLMEPISLPTNVEGGLGFVGISTETKSTILIQENRVIE